MRENRLYGSEGGAARAVPTPISVAECANAASIADMTRMGLLWLT
jgi:hypothetical protein